MTLARNALQIGGGDDGNPLSGTPWGVGDPADPMAYAGVQNAARVADPLVAWLAAQRAKQDATKPIWNPNNRVGTETVQSMGIPQPTTYAGPVGQFIDPRTGRMTERGQARLDNPAFGLDTGGVGMVKKVMPVRAFHGSPNDFEVFDPTRVGSEAMAAADRWAKTTKHSDEYYLTTNADHAAGYGDYIHEFQIDRPLLKKNAKAELETWAKDEGYPDAQKHIDEYYDGSVYHALDADNYFKEVLREAKEAGLPGARVSFGDLTSTEGSRRVPVGDIIVLHDPAAAKRVGTRRQSEPDSDAQ